MKTAQKRVLSLFLALALILSASPLSAAAVDLSKISALDPQVVASGTIKNLYSDLSWSLDENGMLTISGSGIVDCLNDWKSTNYRDLVKQLKLEGNFTRIQNWAFSSNENLAGRVDFPEGIVYIGANAFAGTGITVVSIPASVTEISSNAFKDCPLTDIYYGGSKAQWERITLGQPNGELNAAAIHYALSDPAPAPSTASAAPKGITVLVNGAPVQFDVQPQLINSRTMVPLRAIFEALGASVEWDGKNRAIYSSKDDTHVTLWVNDPKMVVTRAGKTETKTLDTAPIIKNSRTLVPVRAIAEAYGCEVGWDQASKTVTIAAAQPPAPADDGKMLEGKTRNQHSAYISDNGVACYSFVNMTDMYIYDGNEVRTYPAGGVPQDIVAVGDNIYYRTKAGAVYVMDMRSGKRDILFSEKGICGFAIYRGKAFVRASGGNNKSCLYMVDLDTRKSTLLYEVAEKDGIRFNTRDGSAIACSGDYIMLAGPDYGQEYKEGVTVILSGVKININTGAVSKWFTTEALASTDYWADIYINVFFQYEDSLYLNVGGSYSYHKVDIPAGTFRESTREEYYRQQSLASSAEIDRTWAYDYVDKSVIRTHRSSGLKETIFTGDNYSLLLAHNDDMLVVYNGPGYWPAVYQSGTIYVMEPDGNGVRAISINRNGTITNYSGGTNTGNNGGSGNDTTPEPRSCTACSGTGKVKCPACGGTGDASFTMLGQTVKQNCVPCNHTGWIQCGECGGKGSK